MYALQVFYATGSHLQAVRPSAYHIAKNFRWQRGANNNYVFVWMLPGIASEFAFVVQSFLLEARHRLGIPWLQEPANFLFKGVNANLIDWNRLQTMRCVVLLPWDLQLTLFPELYALGVPIVLPTAEYTATYALRFLRSRGILFWAVNPVLGAKLP